MLRPAEGGGWTRERDFELYQALGLHFRKKCDNIPNTCPGAVRPFHADHALRGLKGTMLSWVL